jgi:hypothetical protein
VTIPGKLSYQVFISDPVPFNVTERAPNGDRRMFQPISSTLIVGATDAVLVDPPMTAAQTEPVAAWVEDGGTRRYLADAERLIGTSHTAPEFYNAMVELHPDRLNPSAPWSGGAKTLFENVEERRTS